MNLREAMEIAKGMEAQYKAFSKISEFLTEVHDFSTTATNSEKRLSSLKREIDEMEVKKAAAQAEIAKQTKEAIESGEKLIANLKLEAKSVAVSLAEAKQRVSRDIDEMAARKIVVTDQMNKEVKDLITAKSAIEQEISDLTKAKATLEAEIKLMKEKVASFLN